jgi:hypothetical protein
VQQGLRTFAGITIKTGIPFGIFSMHIHDIKLYMRHFMYEGEKPSLKQFLLVLLATAVLIGLSWIAYYKFGLFR